MNEEYLWDKTGGDAEIEELENALAAFRYRRTPPPAVEPFAAIAAAAPAEKPPKTRREFFRLRLGFALAAAAALVLLTFALLDRLAVPVPNGGRDIAARPVATETTAPEDIPLAPPAPQNRFAENESEKNGLPQRPPLVANRPRGVTTAAAARRAKTTAPPAALRAQKIVSSKSPKLVLSKEEQAAYDQLMLALSITSSKLKIVKDKALGLENGATVQGK